ncbi:hypothetical protein H2O64_00230 [Kordia sp. YSTF-M3]|uniref:Bacteriocin n=1 Tax=Kordia aestuariivivens TaxID=2759037 RepID=A0ABR7Q3E0_9FLAO|nr:hypothetical protein [Kordia aestuariivivens]MBC8753076.1 hypothetical protein [Kordia aestuariivivens]
MLKNILNLDGVETLSKKAQQEINGGLQIPVPQNCNGVYCPSYCHCISAYNSYCVFTSGRRQGQFCYAL